MGIEIITISQLYMEQLGRNQQTFSVQYFDN